MTMYWTQKMLPASPVYRPNEPTATGWLKEAEGCDAAASAAWDDGDREHYHALKERARFCRRRAREAAAGIPLGVE